MIRAADKETLAHEIGHYIGWYDSKNNSTHSHRHDSLMAKERTAYRIGPDAQWCEKFCKLAAKGD